MKRCSVRQARSSPHLSTRPSRSCPSPLRRAGKPFRLATFRVGGLSASPATGTAMTLSDLAAVGSLVSGVAVLVSLVYLALQVRQSERNQRAVLNQGYITRVTEYLRWYAESPLNELRARVVQ